MLFCDNTNIKNERNKLRKKGAHWGDAVERSGSEIGRSDCAEFGGVSAEHGSKFHDVDAAQAAQGLQPKPEVGQPAPRIRAPGGVTVAEQLLCCLLQRNHARLTPFQLSLQFLLAHKVCLETL